MASCLVACSSIQTWSADRQLKAGECQDAVEEYEYRFEKKPSIKDNEKIMGRYRKARRCAADQAIDDAIEKLKSGHPTAAYYALQKSLRFSDADKKYNEVANKIKAERNKVWAMLDDAANLAAKTSFGQAADKVRDARKLDPEFTDDEDKGLHKLNKVAEGFITGAEDVGDQGKYLQAESALLLSLKLHPDYQPTREVLADVYGEFARDHVSNKKPGHALLVLVRAENHVKNEGMRSLRSEILAELAGEMQQGFLIKAKKSSDRSYAVQIEKKMDERAIGLFSRNKTSTKSPLWIFSVGNVRQQSDYFEKPENLTKRYRSGYKSVHNPDYDRAADRLSDARREELRYEKKLSRLSEEHSREMDRAQKDRRRIANDKPKDPDKQDSWRRRLANADDKIERLRRQHSRERRNVQSDLQRRRQRVIERERELHKTPRTRREPVYSYWSYQRLHKTREVSTILYLELSTPNATSGSYAGEVHGDWRSTDYTIIGHNRRLGINPKKARLDSMKSVRKHSEASAANKAASWFLKTSKKLLAKSYEDGWKHTAGDKRVELYVKYAVLIESKKRAIADLPYDVDPKDIPTLP